MSLKDKLQALADANGAKFSDKADRIIKVKERAIDEYQCPCYPDDPEHFCISHLCKSEIDPKGRCHCGLYIKKEIENVV